MAPLGEKTGKPSKSRSPGFPTVLNEFARDTNIEGVNNAGRAPSNIRKVILFLLNPVKQFGLSGDLAADLHLPSCAHCPRPGEVADKKFFRNLQENHSGELDQGVPYLAGGRVHHDRPRGLHPLPLCHRVQPEQGQL